MSKMGNYRTRLQDDPCYEDGWKAFHEGLPRDYVEDGQSPYAEDNRAWQAGWDDAQTEE